MWENIVTGVFVSQLGACGECVVISEAWSWI